jgi:hypothetical protein
MRSGGRYRRMFSGSVAQAAAPSYDAATTALLAAMSSQPDSTRAGHIDTLIAGLKTDGVWAELGLLYVMAAHDSQAARLQWLNPGTNTLTPTNTPTFTTDRGYTGGGTSHLLTGVATNAIPNFAQDDNGHGYWLLSSATGTVPVGGTTIFSINPRNASNFVVGRNASVTVGTTTATVVTAAGLTSNTRTVSTDFNIYKDAALLQARTVTSGAIDAQTWMILAQNNGAGVAGNFSSAQVAVFWAGAGLSALQVASLHARLNTYLTAVGAV